MIGVIEISRNMYKKQGTIKKHLQFNIDMKKRQNSKLIYHGYFQALVALRPLINDFLKNAKWFIRSRSKDNTLESLMLKKFQGGG